MKDLRAWRGLAALITDAVEHGTSAVERIHLQTSGRTFSAIEQVVPNPAVRVVADAYTGVVSSVYGSVRGVNRALAVTLDGVLRALEPEEPAPSAASEAEIKERAS